MKKTDLQNIIREEVKKAIKESSTKTLTSKIKKEEVSLTEATGMNVTVTIPKMFIKVFKKFLAGHKQDSEKGESYYEITPGKEAALFSKLFSEWVKINFNAIDEYELMDNFDSDLQLSDEDGFAAVLAKNGLLAKKNK